MVTAKISDLVCQIQKSPKANVKCVHHDHLKPSHVKLDSWLASSKGSVPSEDSVLDLDLSLFSDHAVMTDQEEEVPASEIVKKSFLNNGESFTDAEVVTTTTDGIRDAVSDQTGIVKESFLGSSDKMGGSTTRVGRKTRIPQHLQDYKLYFACQV